MGPAANKRCGGRRHSHVFPHWVNHEMRVDKRFAGRPHACLPTVSQQCARLVRLTTSMRPNTNSLHCSRQPLKALWYLASICSRTSHDRCCNSASTFRRLSFSIAMTAKLLRLIALISSNSGINRSRSTTNVCTNLSALVARSSSMSLPMSWSFSASYMALSLLELLSATSSWTKNHKNDMMKACMQETESVWAPPVVATTSKTSPWPQVCVCGRKHAKIKHAETRGKKKHAGR